MQDGADLGVAEPFADGTPVLVPDPARWLVEHLPAALPSPVAEIGVFQVERREQLVEAAQFQELAAVEGAGAAAAIKARERTVNFVVDPVAHPEHAQLPPAFGEPGLLTALVRIAEENLAGDGEDLLVGKGLEQRDEEVRLDPHVVVQQDDDVVARRPDAGVRAAAEAQVLLESQKPDAGEAFADELRAAVAGAVVHDDDLAARDALGGRHYRGQVFLEQVLAVPVRDDDGSGAVRRAAVVRRRPGAAKDPGEVAKRQGRHGGEGEQRRQNQQGKRPEKSQHHAHRLTSGGPPAPRRTPYLASPSANFPPWPAWPAAPRLPGPVSAPTRCAP